MIGYSEWRNKKNIVEVFEADAVDSFQPKDGKWNPALSENPRYGTEWDYAFNVEADECGTQSDPCYKLHIGFHDGQANISFYRSGSTRDSGKGVQKYVFMSVLKGLSEFIKAKTPDELHWGAVNKSGRNKVTGRVENERAREHIYEKWALRNLFPDKYIPLNAQHWVRKDKYDTEYVSKGYPEISQELADKASRGEMHVGEKARLLTGLRERAKAAEETIRQRELEERERQRREAAERRAEELRRYLENPVENPQGLKLGDIVDTHRAGLDGAGEIIEFFMSGVLYANIRLTQADSSSYQEVGNTVRYRVRELDKETEERTTARAGRFREREERQRREEEERQRIEQEKIVRLVASQDHNPQQLAQGDKVIYFDADNEYEGERSPNGVSGEIVGWQREYSTLYAKVKADEQYVNRFRNYFTISNEGEIIVPPGKLFKDTPETHAHIERKRQERAEAERRAEEERRQREEQRQRERQAAIDQAVQDPSKNPEGIRIGDKVVYFPNLPRSAEGYPGEEHYKGEVTKFDLDYGSLYAKLMSDDTTEKLNVLNLLKDTPDVKQRAEEKARRYQAEQRRSELSSREERRRSRVEGQARQHQQIQSRAEATAAIANDRTRNPVGFKVGDHVEVVGGYRNRGRFGEIVDLREDPYETTTVQAKVKMRGTRGDETWFYLNWLRADASERATVSTARRQRQADRHQQLQAVLQVANPSNFQVGENVTVTSGMNRNRVGQILRFATGSQNNVRATIVDADGNQFTANLNNMRRVQAAA